jgi:hypothetical protein
MDMRSRRKEGFGIPRTVLVIAIAIAFIGLGTKGVKYVLSYSTGKQESVAPNKLPSAKPGITSLSSSAQLGGSLSDYQMIVEGNLFRRLGWQKTVEIPSLPEPVVQRERPYERPKPPNYLTLTGITYLAQEPMALIEDVSRGEAYFVKEGERLKDHVVEAITEENMILVNGNSRITVALGTRANYNSDGELLATAVEEGQMTGSIVEESNEEPAPLEENTASLSIIERMRARRRKELGQE